MSHSGSSCETSTKGDLASFTWMAVGGWPGVLVHLLDRSDGPSEPPSLHEAGPEQQQGGNSNAADSSSAARGLPGVPPLSPYRVRHFRSGREGVAIETNIAGDRLHIFFADRASYEWRWTSAFPQQEALQGQPPPGQLPARPPSATPGTGTQNTILPLKRPRAEPTPQQE